MRYKRENGIDSVLNLEYVYNVLLFSRKFCYKKQKDFIKYCERMKCVLTFPKKKIFLMKYERENYIDILLNLEYVFGVLLFAKSF